VGASQASTVHGWTQNKARPGRKPEAGHRGLEADPRGTTRHPWRGCAHKKAPPLVLKQRGLPVYVNIQLRFCLPLLFFPFLVTSGLWQWGHLMSMVISIISYYFFVVFTPLSYFVDHHQILVCSNKVLVTGNKVLISGNKVLVTGNKVLVAGNKVLVCGNKVLISGNKVLISGNKVLVAGNKVLVCGNKVLVFDRKVCGSSRATDGA
jgi:hypothetical protein